MPSPEFGMPCGAPVSLGEAGTWGKGEEKPEGPPQGALLGLQGVERDPTRRGPWEPLMLEF